VPDGQQGWFIRAACPFGSSGPWAALVPLDMRELRRESEAFQGQSCRPEIWYLSPGSEPE
ncbi:MAG: hypothetical protein ACK58O_10645, partial [Brevundimonas sp.]